MLSNAAYCRLLYDSDRISNVLISAQSLLHRGAIWKNSVDSVLLAHQLVQEILAGVQRGINEVPTAVDRILDPLTGVAAEDAQDALCGNCSHAGPLLHRPSFATKVFFVK